MNDLDLIKTCADRMEIAIVWDDGGYVYSEHYNPLADDAQAMALLKKFRLNIGQLSNGGCKVFVMANFKDLSNSESKYLNRAICECVAKLEKLT